MDASRAVAQDAPDSVTSVSRFGHTPVTKTRKGGGEEIAAEAVVTPIFAEERKGTS